MRDIEFLSTQAGREAPCPTCGKAVTVPGTPVRQPPPPPPPPQPRPPPRSSGPHIHARSKVKLDPILPPDEPDEPEGKIRCRCPHCNRILRVAQTLAGQVSACPGCGGQFTVPQEPAQPADQDFEVVEEAVTTGAPEARIRCRCPHCKRILQVAPANAGQVSSCPGCGGQFTVPKAMAEAVAQPEQWEPGARPKRKRRRRRRYDYDDDYSGGDGSFERGRVFAIVIGIVVVLLTLLNVLYLMFMSTQLGRDPRMPAGAVQFAVGIAALFIVVRLIGAIGLMCGQDWGRLLLGYFLIIMGFCSICVIVQGNFFGLIDLVINFALGITLLVSPSIATYTQS